jgi:ribA/ribD-fused uncharacterized protein
MLNAVLAKFGQDEDLHRILLDTGSKTLVECSKTDTVWGNGLALGDSKSDDYTEWEGQNLLGMCLEEVKKQLN